MVDFIQKFRLFDKTMGQNNQIGKVSETTQAKTLYKLMERAKQTPILFCAEKKKMFSSVTSDLGNNILKQA